MFVHTPREATPAQEHLGLSKCFGICYMYMYVFGICFGIRLLINNF